MNNNTKLTIYDNNLIIIEDYQNLKYNSNCEIIIDHYMIEGCNLEIVFLDDYLIKIKGYYEVIRFV